MSDYYDDDEENNTGGHNTLPVFFLFFMLLLAFVLLLGRSLHNRPKLNSILSEPAMILMVSVFFSFLIKILFVSSSGDDDDNDDDGQQQANNDDNNGNNNSNNNNNNNNSNNNYGGVDQNQLSKFLFTFSGELFFMVFLPPIMFNSGYELKRELFFRHLKPIVSFAVVGTAVSGIVTGLSMYGTSSLTGWMGEDVVEMNLFEFLTFGSLITATDTVSVLGVLNAKKVNPHLFSLVFGESALNDAVAIVLFQSFSRLVRMGGIENQQSLVHEISSFVTVFLLDIVGCPIMGMIFAFVSALVFKHMDFHGTPILELSLYILIIYFPFIVAEVLGMSGIVTIFFTGIFARRYIEPNISEETKHNAEVIFSLVAYLAEVCIFINLGLSVFGFQGSFHWSFIGVAFLASLIGRAMSIYPISFFSNLSLVEYKERPVLSPSSNRRATVDVALSMDVGYDITTAISTMNEEEEIPTAAAAAATHDSSAGNNTKCIEEDGSSVGTGIMRQRHTPDESLDKIIPSKFMHFLWFAGLRGAVAYACARDFPNVHGNKDEVIAATMVIVFFSVIVMGAFCDPLLKILNIQMGVDNQEYMKEWRNRRSLDGRIHQLEKRFVYDVVVRDKSDNVEVIEKPFQLTNVDGTLPQSTRTVSECECERAMTASAVARTLTGSGAFVM